MLNTVTGVLDGTPTATGNHLAELRATDLRAASVAAPVRLWVLEPDASYAHVALLSDVSAQRVLDRKGGSTATPSDRR